MDWKSFPDELPPDSGNYTASIKRQKSAGQYIFSDLTYYDAKERKWYKYDPFDDKYKPTEDITDLVVGWASDTGAYLGTVRN